MLSTLLFFLTSEQNTGHTEIFGESRKGEIDHGLWWDQGKHIYTHTCAHTLNFLTTLVALILKVLKNPGCAIIFYDLQCNTDCGRLESGLSETGHSEPLSVHMSSINAQP